MPDLLAAASAPVAHPIALGIDPTSLLNSFGLVGLMVILFAECGLLIGFFLPGDTLLLAAGIAVAIDPGKMPPLWAWLVLAPLAAIAGNLVGYWIGFKSGPRVFQRPDSKLFDPAHVERAQHFFNKYGMWTVILARFVPVVRTFATVMAGVGKMEFTRYALFSVIGGILWTTPILFIGHALGHVQWVVDHKQWLDYIIVAIVLASLTPTLLHYLRRRRQLARQQGGVKGL